MTTTPPSTTLVRCKPTNSRKSESSVSKFAKAMLERRKIPAAAVAAHIPQLLSLWSTQEDHTKLLLLHKLVAVVQASNEHLHKMHPEHSPAWHECMYCHENIVNMLHDRRWTHLIRPEKALHDAQRSLVHDAQRSLVQWLLLVTAEAPTLHDIVCQALHPR
jgi:hypothetical protein